MIKITTLIENNPDDNGELLFEHGLSLYIETNGTKILFDTGKSGDFLKNAKSLNKSLEELDFCIISHGHYDHSGGVIKLISKISKYPRFIVGEEFFKLKYKTVETPYYIFNGNSFDEDFLRKNNVNLIKVKKDMIYLTNQIIVFHHFFRYTDYEKRNSRFYIKENEEYLPDDFDDEIVLGMITDKGLVVVVGCSHVGIINILKTISERVDIPIYAVVGGTHLIEADECRMQKTMDALKEMKVQLIAVSHCTGEEGIQHMRQELKQQFHYNNTGNVIEI
ncbi:MAG: MBL fold metallo-hydrolase [Lachnospiraceae bacterium]|nr:MBL fold metallo-hydrolase [Lachnospiraceae bacterium]